MKDGQLEWFQKWAGLSVSAMALMLTCVMGPVAFTLKATVKDIVRQELAGYETIAASEARWKAREEHENEMLKRLEHDLAAARERAAQSETNNYKLMLELGNRLSALEAKLEQMIREHQRDTRAPANPGPQGQPRQPNPN